MNNPNTDSGDWAARNVKNTRRLAYWTFAWVASTAIAAFAPKFVWDFNTLLTILAVLLNVGVGIGMILANKRYLNGLDEMHRRIFLDAGSLSLGVGLVCGIVYELMEDIRLISFEPEISHLVILMALTFLAGTIAGNRKYR